MSVLCNEVVLLMMVDDEPAVAEVCILPAVTELCENVDVVLPSVLEVVDMLELDCVLELLLNAPLLDPIDGPETPVGVVLFDAGACAVQLVAEDHWNFMQGYRIRLDAWSCSSKSL